MKTLQNYITEKILINKNSKFVCDSVVDKVKILIEDNGEFDFLDKFYTKLEKYSELNCYVKFPHTEQFLNKKQKSIITKIDADYCKGIEKAISSNNYNTIKLTNSTFIDYFENSVNFYVMYFGQAPIKIYICLSK